MTAVECGLFMGLILGHPMARQGDFKTVKKFARAIERCDHGEARYCRHIQRVCDRVERAGQKDAV